VIPELKMPEENVTPATEVNTPTSEPSSQKMVPESEIQQLLDTLKKVRKERDEAAKQSKDLTSQLSRFEEINPDEYRKLQVEAEQNREQQARFGAAQEALEEKYKGVAAEAVGKAEKAERALEEFKKRSALEKLFFAAGGRTDAADGVSFFDMLASQIAGNFRQEPDGSLTVIDVQGDPILDPESGKRINPEDFVSGYKTHKIYGTFFKGAKGAGAGIGYGGTDSNGMPIEDLQGMNTTELFRRAFG
jgi:hypothetical protein